MEEDEGASDAKVAFKAREEGQKWSPFGQQKLEKRENNKDQVKLQNSNTYIENASR